ncbi:enamine deaminase RidA (YjgF/YER057c/UK114 family) [Streptomyces sp. 3330]|uniref:RidA family protein n=1 Tax=Streptomyces sp. 3330 TaxID=2817755 RepID=UPI0028645A7B|nr:RidA family protein [Streptomyces sp. 3330]MDR6980022.1 enamine deaminase RidA (YjgF/YER057c/UK114 family) [Streptomyces sp. 3330]
MSQRDSNRDSNSRNLRHRHSQDERTITNPPALHDPTPFGYSHAVSAPGEPVFVAGQYASDASGAPVPGDFAAQVELAFDRLEAAPAGVGLGLRHVVRLGTFVVDHDPGRLEILGKALHARFGERLSAQTLSGVAALAPPGMLFEVDAIAVRPSPQGEGGYQGRDRS